MSRQLYARVFTQILDSSLAENWQTRHVFEDILKLADDGVVDMTRQAISRRTNVPLDVVNAAIGELESPDPASRDAAEQGRRLLRMDQHRDWGWLIVNWEKYEAIKSTADQREQARERKRRQRQRQHGEHLPPSPQPEQQNQIQTQKQKQRGVTCHDVSRSNRDIDTQGGAEAAPAPREFAFREVPSWEAVKFHADKIGLPDWRAKLWFDEMESVGWVDKNRRPIHRWQSALTTVKTYWEADGRPSAPRSRQNPTTPTHVPIPKHTTQSIDPRTL